MAPTDSPRAKYDAALSTVKEAQRVFDAVSRAYRAGKIDDAEFLAARKVFKAADAAFDAAERAYTEAEEAASANASEAPTDSPETHQMSLF